MSSKLKVSVIMLNYNSGEEIFESIQSVIEQEYENIELVIADDASKCFQEEEIVSFIEQKKRNNLIYQIITNKENQGTVRNMNNAVKAASGEIIINLSAGDLFVNKEIVSRIVEEFSQTDCEFLITRRILFIENTLNTLGFIPSDYDINKIKSFKNAKEEYVALFTSDFHDLASGSVLSYRKCFLEKQGYYDEKYRLWEDGPFFGKLLKQGIRINYNFSIVSIYYRSGGVSTGKPSPIMVKDIELFLSDALKDNDSFKGFNRRKLEYAYMKKTQIFDDKIKTILYRIKFWDVMLYRFFQKIDRYIFDKKKNVEVIK